LLRNDRYRFWKELGWEEDKIVANVASKLMSAAACEAVCERAFSHLGLVYCAEKKRVSLQNIADCVLLKVNNDIDFHEH
jgi:broad-specificity NMP kinase